VPWQADIEPSFLLDYSQFGSKLRVFAESRLHATGGDDDERRLCVAALAQQVGHAFEDLAAILGGLALWQNPAAKVASPKWLRKNPLNGAPLYTFLTNNAGSLKIEELCRLAPDTVQIPSYFGLNALAKVQLPGLPAEASRFALAGVVDHVIGVIGLNASELRDPFLKAKHGAPISSDLSLFGGGNANPGLLLEDDSTGKPRGLAVPLDFGNTLRAEIRRAGAMVRLLIALYLQAQHTGIWARSGVAPNDIIDAEVWSHLEQETAGPVIVGSFDVADAFPSGS
jgi:hypothetical protein